MHQSWWVRESNDHVFYLPTCEPCPLGTRKGVKSTCADHTLVSTTPSPLAPTIVDHNLVRNEVVHSRKAPRQAATEPGGNTFKRGEDFYLKNGSSQGQNLAFTVLTVLNSRIQHSSGSTRVSVPSCCRFTVQPVLNSLSLDSGLGRRPCRRPGRFPGSQASVSPTPPAARTRASRCTAPAFALRVLGG